jgi:DNA-cytosine methyltransferase
MNVLSLFDGMSCGQLALDQLGIKVDTYYASEIDKYAIQIAKKNYPETKHLGDVREIKAKNLLPIDLLIGGSPCQGFSKAGKGLNFSDPRSALFFEFVRILKETKPKYFLLENVRMKKEYQDIISEHLGVEPIQINSSLLSAQNRVRLYWTNLTNIKQPIDKNIVLKDILETGQVDRDKSFCIDANYFKGGNLKSYYEKHRRQLVFNLVVPEATKKGFTTIEDGDCFDATFLKSKTRRGRNMKYKSNCLTAAPYEYMKYTHPTYRKLLPIECERLQTVPDNYTEGVSNSQRYRMLGNGWTVEVIKHILDKLKEK